MNKYKVEFTQTKTLVVDVLADNEAEAQEKAKAKMENILKSGMEHYHQTGETETLPYMTYDVTNTDDPFNP